MTIRDIVVAFGFEVDRASERQAENSIKGIKSMATKLLGGIAVVLSVSHLSAFARDCAQAASDVEQMQNKFDVVFDGITGDVERWAEDFAHAVGRNKNTIKGYLADQQNLLVGFGMTREEGAKLSEEMTSLALDLASFANTDETAAVNVMTKAVMGESEAAKTLGAVLNDSTRAAAMAKMGLSGNYQALDQLAKMQVNYNAILMQSPDAVGDCVRSIGSYEARQRQLNSSVMEFKEFVGGKLLPLFAIWTSYINTGVQWMLAFAKAVLGATEEENRLFKAFGRVNALIKRLQPAFGRLAQTIRNGISRATDVIGRITDKLGGMENALKILAVLAGAFFLALNWGKVAGAAGAVLKLFGFLGKVFSLVALKVLAVVAVVAVLALAVEDFIQFLLGNDSVIGTIFDKAGIGADHARQAVMDAWGKIKGFLLDGWDVLKTAAGMYVDTVRAFFERHSESIRANVERVWGMIRTFLNGVWSFLSQLAATLFGNTEENIDGSTKSTKDKLLEAWQDALDALSAVWDAIYGAASAVFSAMATLAEFWFGCVQVFWAKWGQQVLGWFKMVWDTLGSMLGHFLDVVKGVAKFIEAVFTGDWAGAWEAVKQILVSNWGMMEDFLTAAWETIKLLFAIGIDTLTGLWEKFWAACAAILMMAWEAILSALAGAKEAVIQVFLDILSGATSKVAEIRTAVVDGFQAAIDWIQGLPPQAVQWGADFIGGLKEGILSGVRGIEEAVKGVGDKIRSYLHFSVPDVGPLTDYERWMPDFMGGLADGIAGNEDLVLDKVRGLAGGIRVLMSAATANAATAAIGAVSSRSSSVVQNVNIDNTYSGGSREAQGNVARAMRKSAEDATGYMARGLAYARG